MSSLLEVNGVRLDGRRVPDYFWNADLIDFDGPLLSLYKSEDGQDVLFSWLDCDAKHHLWCVIPVGRDHLWKYLTQMIPLLDVFKAASKLLLFKTTAKSRRTGYVACHWKSLPSDYLPSEDSYLFDEISTPAAKRLASELATDCALWLDGELYLEDLELIPKLYQQLYSFHYGVEHLGRSAIQDVISKNMRKYRGGFSVVNMFSGLRNVTPSIHRARIVELKYNSPGYIRLNMLPEMASSISRSVDGLVDDSEHEKAEQLYKEIYRYFRDAGLSGFDSEKAERETPLTTRQSEVLSGYVVRLLSALSMSRVANQFNGLEVSPLGQVRVLLAYYRRLRRLRSYIVRGQLRLT